MWWYDIPDVGGILQLLEWIDIDPDFMIFEFKPNNFLGLFDVFHILWLVDVFQLAIFGLYDINVFATVDTYNELPFKLLLILQFIYSSFYTSTCVELKLNKLISIYSLHFILYNINNAIIYIHNISTFILYLINPQI